MHICANKLPTIGQKDDGLSSGRREAITWTNAGGIAKSNLRNKFECHSYIFVQENAF